jgi:TPP-dependent pyruvate/acetoin dehydrogenase alpha subunit
MSDPGSTYRTRDEISGVRQERDPIERIRKLLLSLEIASVSDLKTLEKEAKSEVDEALAKAKVGLPDPFLFQGTLFLREQKLRLCDKETSCLDLCRL